MRRGVGIGLYGGEGLGKTSWAVQWALLGSVKVMSLGEIGYLDLELGDEIPPGCRNVQINNFEELDKETVNATEDILVYDSLMGVQSAIFDYVCRTQFDSDWSKFTDYWKGQRIYSPPVFEKWLSRLSAHLAAGRHVIIIGHMLTDTLPNTLGADYKSHVIALDEGDKGGMRSVFMRWAPNVFFLNINIDIQRVTEEGTRANKGMVIEGKAYDRDQRVLYTVKAPGHAAKNKLQLPPVISMGDSAKQGFENFIKALPEHIRNKVV